jgi:Sporulation and spore germination/Immunoglobulin-like domain of bacterial spore germination
MSDDDVYAERLRQVLNGEGSAMEIADDGLARILQQAHQPTRGRRPGWLAPLAVAAAAVVLLGGVALGVGLIRGGNNGTAQPGPAGSGSTSSTPSPSPSPSTSPSGPSASASQSPSPSTSTSTTGSSQAPPPPVTRAYAIYYVADVPGFGPRLYREFHALVPDKDNAGVALAELFGGNATDPDYTSIWPSGTQALSVTSQGDLATVDVSDFPAVGSQAESLAVQQVVWTVTASQPDIKQVQLLVNGKPPKSGSLDLSKPVRRASALDVEANVWILAPTEGQTVTSPVKVTVYGTGFEGNVPLKIFKDGVQVAAKPVTTQQGGFAQASTTFTLSAGSYEVRAYNDNGKNGTLQLWDTKTFTVG